jgi:uncharacterized protein YukE
MAGNTDVDVRSLNKLIGEVQGAISETQRVRNHVDQVRGNVLSAYQGGAAPQFNTSMQRWLEKAGEVQRFLQQVLDALQSHASNQQALGQDTHQAAGSWAK